MTEPTIETTNNSLVQCLRKLTTKSKERPVLSQQE